MANIPWRRDYEMEKSDHPYPEIELKENNQWIIDGLKPPPKQCPYCLSLHRHSFRICGDKMKTTQLKTPPTWFTSKENNEDKHLQERQASLDAAEEVKARADTQDRSSLTPLELQIVLTRMCLHIGYAVANTPGNRYMQAYIRGWNQRSMFPHQYDDKSYSTQTLAEQDAQKNGYRHAFPSHMTFDEWWHIQPWDRLPVFTPLDQPPLAYIKAFEYGWNLIATNERPEKLSIRDWDPIFTQGVDDGMKWSLWNHHTYRDLANINNAFNMEAATHSWINRDPTQKTNTAQLQHDIDGIQTRGNNLLFKASNAVDGRFDLPPFVIITSIERECNMTHIETMGFIHGWNHGITDNEEDAPAPPPKSCKPYKNGYRIGTAYAKYGHPTYEELRLQHDPNYQLPTLQQLPQDITNAILTTLTPVRLETITNAVNQAMTTYLKGQPWGPILAEFFTRIEATKEVKKGFRFVWDVVTLRRTQNPWRPPTPKSHPDWKLGHVCAQALVQPDDPIYADVIAHVTIPTYAAITQTKNGPKTTTPMVTLDTTSMPEYKDPSFSKAFKAAWTCAQKGRQLQQVPRPDDQLGILNPTNWSFGWRAGAAMAIPGGTTFHNALIHAWDPNSHYYHLPYLPLDKPTRDIRSPANGILNLLKMLFPINPDNRQPNHDFRKAFEAAWEGSKNGWEPYHASEDVSRANNYDLGDFMGYMTYTVSRGKPLYQLEHYQGPSGAPTVTKPLAMQATTAKLQQQPTLDEDGFQVYNKKKKKRSNGSKKENHNNSMMPDNHYQSVRDFEQFRQINEKQYCTVAAYRRGFQSSCLFFKDSTPDETEPEEVHTLFRLGIAHSTRMAYQIISIVTRACNYGKTITTRPHPTEQGNVFIAEAIHALHWGMAHAYEHRLRQESILAQIERNNHRRASMTAAETWQELTFWQTKMTELIEDTRAYVKYQDQYLSRLRYILEGSWNIPHKQGDQDPPPKMTMEQLQEHLLLQNQDASTPEDTASITPTHQPEPTPAVPNIHSTKEDTRKTKPAEDTPNPEEHAPLDAPPQPAAPQLTAHADPDQRMDVDASSSPQASPSDIREEDRDTGAFPVPLDEPLLQIQNRIANERTEVLIEDRRTLEDHQKMESHSKDRCADYYFGKALIDQGYINSIYWTIPHPILDDSATERAFKIHTITEELKRRTPKNENEIPRLPDAEEDCIPPILGGHDDEGRLLCQIMMDRYLEEARHQDQRNHISDPEYLKLKDQAVTSIIFQHTRPSVWRDEDPSRQAALNRVLTDHRQALNLEELRKYNKMRAKHPLLHSYRLRASFLKPEQLTDEHTRLMKMKNILVDQSKTYNDGYDHGLYLIQAKTSLTDAPHSDIYATHQFPDFDAIHRIGIQTAYKLDILMNKIHSFNKLLDRQGWTKERLHTPVTAPNKKKQQFLADVAKMSPHRLQLAQRERQTRLLWTSKKYPPTKMGALLAIRLIKSQDAELDHFWTSDASEHHQLGLTLATEIHHIKERLKDQELTPLEPLDTRDITTIVDIPPTDMTLEKAIDLQDTYLLQYMDAVTPYQNGVHKGQTLEGYKYGSAINEDRHLDLKNRQSGDEEWDCGIEGAKEVARARNLYLKYTKYANTLHQQLVVTCSRDTDALQLHKIKYVEDYYLRQVADQDEKEALATYHLMLNKSVHQRQLDKEFDVGYHWGQLILRLGSIPDQQTLTRSMRDGLLTSLDVSHTPDTPWQHDNTLLRTGITLGTCHDLPTGTGNCRRHGQA